MLRAPRRPLAVALATAIAVGSVAGCSINPATGKRQLALIGEQQEIEMGRHADRELVAELGLYPDEGLQTYVSNLGKQLAARSERPHLPWTFRVIDDPVVNAFALPGGFIYVTRGILAHMGSEAELVSVLGHEIGHVSGRHGVEQMSKAQLATVGLVAGMVVAPELAQYGDLAQAGLGLLFLKYGRDDEREADALGLRYLLADGYDPREMPNLFETLRRVSAAAGGGGRMPAWLSTHPDPEERRDRIRAEIAAMGRDWTTARVEREGFVRRLDGMVFGPNPREGYFEGDVFYHPEMAFQLRFPPGWKGQNQKQAVGAMAPKQDALVVLTLADAASPDEAARKFFAQANVRQGNPLRGRGFAGLPAVASTFGVDRAQQGNLAGVAAWVRHRELVFELVGYTTETGWPNYQSLLADAVRSFAPVTDRRVLDVQPDRLKLVPLRTATTVEELARRYPGNDVTALALVNAVEPGSTLAAGTLAKVVLGGRTPR
jgi:predicted Zn-dependent protease